MIEKLAELITLCNLAGCSMDDSYFGDPFGDFDNRSNEFAYQSNGWNEEMDTDTSVSIPMVFPGAADAEADTNISGLHDKFLDQILEECCEGFHMTERLALGHQRTTADSKAGSLAGMSSVVNLSPSSHLWDLEEGEVTDHDLMAPEPTVVHIRTAPLRRPGADDNLSSTANPGMSYSLLSVEREPLKVNTLLGAKGSAHLATATNEVIVPLNAVPKKESTRVFGAMEDLYKMLRKAASYGSFYDDDGGINKTTFSRACRSNIKLFQTEEMMEKLAAVYRRGQTNMSPSGPVLARLQVLNAGFEVLAASRHATAHKACVYAWVDFNWLLCFDHGRELGENFGNLVSEPQLTLYFVSVFPRLTTCKQTRLLMRRAKSFASTSRIGNEDLDASLAHRFPPGSPGFFRALRHFGLAMSHPSVANTVIANIAWVHSAEFNIRRREGNYKTYLGAVLKVFHSDGYIDELGKLVAGVMELRGRDGGVHDKHIRSLLYILERIAAVIIDGLVCQGVIRPVCDSPQTPFKVPTAGEMHDITRLIDALLDAWCVSIQEHELAHSEHLEYMIANVLKAISEANRAVFALIAAVFGDLKTLTNHGCHFSKLFQNLVFSKFDPERVVLLADSLKKRLA